MEIDKSEEAESHSHEESSILDWRGRPSNPAKHGGMLPAAFILGPSLTLNLLSILINDMIWYNIWCGVGLQAFEIMAIAAVGNNLITYVTTEMHMSLSKAANVVTNFVGTIFLLALLGGYLSDSYLGTFWTILIFGFLELSVISLHSLLSLLFTLYVAFPLISFSSLIAGFHFAIGPSSCSSVEATSMQYDNWWTTLRRSKGLQSHHILSSTLLGGVREWLCQAQHACLWRRPVQPKQSKSIKEPLNLLQCSLFCILIGRTY